MLDGKSVIPLYAQLAADIEKKISNREYLPGQRLQTEREMAKTYGISIITVRKAIDVLIEKRLIERKQGKGTFVSKPKFSRNVKKLQGFSEMCVQMGVTPGARMLENRLVTADSKTAAKLEIEPKSKVVLISRLRFADNEPVQIEKNYFPIKYAFLLNAKLDNNSMLAYLKESCGAQVASSEKVIELCRATDEEAELLNVKKGDYLLFVKSTAYDENGDPLYVGIQIINGDRFSLYVYEGGA